MSWAIIADSSCNLRSFTPTASDAAFFMAPLTIHVGGTEFRDDDSLDVGEMNRRVAAEPAATSSSCPSAGEWAGLFRQAENIIAITISSNLSGSYESALMARNIVMDEVMRENDGVIAGKNIFVLDSKAAGGKMELIVKLLDRFLAAGDATFEDAVGYVTRLERASTVLFSLGSYDNLVKNGRMPKLAGAIAGKVHIRLLGAASKQGTIKVVGTTRSERSTIRRITDHMAKDGFQGGAVCIDHVGNLEGARKLAGAIEDRWPASTVEILPCGGLCSYYAEQAGLIVGYEWL